MKKYVKLYEEFTQQESTLLTDPTQIAKWIDSWKDSWVSTKIILHSPWNKQDVNTKRPSNAIFRLNGTYIINSDGTVDVDGDVYLHESNLKEIPIQFGEVTGDFNIADNLKLTSLRGCPHTVGKAFIAMNNKRITTLKYGPINVGGYFGVGWCNLTTLEYCPHTVGGKFSCVDNVKMISDGNECNILGEFSGLDKNTHINKKRERYLEYLSLICPDVAASINWLKRVDGELYDNIFQGMEAIEYFYNNNLTAIVNRLSDDVKNIASVALKGNHKLR